MQENNRYLYSTEPKQGMSRFDDFFTLGRVIDQGAYGKVCFATNIQKEKYAVKIMQHDSHDGGISASGLREISLLSSLDHKNIIYKHKAYNDIESKIIYIYNVSSSNQSSR